MQWNRMLWLMGAVLLLACLFLSNRAKSQDRATGTVAAQQGKDFGGRRKELLKALPGMIDEAKENPDRQFALGLLYAQGIKGRPDFAEAVEWYQKAAEGGYQPAMYLLAIMKIEGLGAQRDYGAAAEWAQKLADSGNSSGYVLLGMLYESGSGVPQDDEKAVQSYGYASRDSVDIGALYRMGMFSLEGKGMAADPQQALRWLEAAANGGDRQARYQLGTMYYEGKGVQADFGQARRWFEKTLNRRKRDIQKRFPDIFGAAGVEGEDYTKNMERMMKKDPHVKRNANFMLAVMYEKGQGVEASRECAGEYYAKSAKAGHMKAKKRLAEMKREDARKLKANKRQERLAAKEAARQKKDVAAAPEMAKTSEKDTILHEEKSTASVAEPRRPIDKRDTENIVIRRKAGMSAASVSVQAQETDEMEEVIGIMGNPVIQTIMEMTAQVSRWSPGARRY